MIERGVQSKQRGAVDSFVGWGGGGGRGDGDDEIFYFFLNE